jgi:Fe-S cluster assembly protein SufD
LTTAVEHYVAARDGLALPGAGLAWLDDLRTAGARRFSQAGFPNLRDENWRYTNIRPILRQNFSPAAAVEPSAARAALTDFEVRGLESHRLVFVNGRYQRDLSDADGLPEGVVAVSMADAVVRGIDGVEERLGSCVPEDLGGFTALNTAYIEDGLYLEVDAGCRVERPIDLVFVCTEPGGQLVQPRNLLVTGEGSSVHIIERYISVAGRSHLTNAVTELSAGKASVVEHTRLQQEAEQAFHVAGLFIRIGGGAHVVSNNVALGSMIARTNLHVELREEGASCDLNGVYLGSGRQHIDNFTQVDHAAPDCRSDEYYKGVLDDRARAVFHGRVIVREGAQLTDAQQQNRNLLLSDDAEVNTKPQLEIYADDVKCSHGATIGQLDDNAMFYLRTRGIDEITARGLLTYAFAADVINRISSVDVRGYLTGVLGRKLFGVERIAELT